MESRIVGSPTTLLGWTVILILASTFSAFCDPSIIKVVGGNDHSLLLRTDGSVWSWGANWSGQLGVGSHENKIRPTQVVGLADVISVAGGFGHSLALKSDGTVWAWGQNYYGELGIDSAIDPYVSESPTPLQVPGLEDIVAIAAGHGVSIALKQDGTVWTWGYNNSGVLGDGSSSYFRPTPTKIEGLEGVSGIAASMFHVLALKNDGTVMAWGANWYGQLGLDSSIPNSNIPVAVPGLTGVQQVVCGHFHSLVLKNDGTVWAWGLNAAGGQLGVEASALYQSSSPLQIPNLADVTFIAAGFAHNLAVKQDGTLWAWGSNASGELGDETRVDEHLPNLVALPGEIQTVGAGSYHSMAVSASGVVLSWGLNGSGQLGDQVNVVALEPVEMLALSHVKSVDAGSDHAVAVLEDGSVRTWGSNEQGQLGVGNFLPRTGVNQVVSLQDVVGVSSGIGYNLALKADGSVWAWGDNGDGKLGHGGFSAQPTPMEVAETDLFSAATKISAGDSHSLVIGTDAKAFAWGNNGNGRLGDGTTVGKPAAVPVTATELETVLDVSAGSSHSLALRNDGTVWAWGNGANGRLGHGGTGSVNVPYRSGGRVSLANISSISAGGDFSLALGNDGRVWGWGGNSSGQLGDGSSNQRILPVQNGSLNNIKEISAGSSHSLALRQNGSVLSFGGNGEGQLGDGTTEGRFEPVSINTLEGVKSLAAGNRTSVALKEDGRLSIWGSGNKGMLANGFMSIRHRPRVVSDLNALLDLPGVTIALPQNGVVVPVGQVVNIQAEWESGGVSISRVEYFNNDGTKIGESEASPWSIDWSPPTWGNFLVKAVASDSEGNRISSEPVRILSSSDGDGSGLPDWWEIKYFGHLGISPEEDADGDGLSNSQEVWHGTHPTVADSDADGTSDAEEISAGTNPYVADSDGDGMPDGFEIANGLNPRVNDAFDDEDGDRVPNLWEYVHGTEVNNKDSRPLASRIVSHDGTGGHFTLQSALNAVAQDYEIIEIKGGLYTGNASNTSNRKKVLILGQGGAGNLRTELAGVSGTTLAFYCDALVDGVVLTKLDGQTGEGLFVYGLDNPVRVRLSNCRVTGVGGANVVNVYNSGQHLELVNTSITGNAAVGNATLYNPNAHISLINSIVWNPDQVVAELAGSGSFTVRDSIVRGGLQGAFDEDPLLTEAGMLTQDSPARGRGNFAGVSVDIDDEARPTGAGVDLGWDQYVDADADGLLDWWELNYFGDLEGEAGADGDGDGLTNLEEQIQQSDPTNYFSQGSLTIDPVLSVAGGNHQRGEAGSVAVEPLVVLVTDGTNPLVNAPVTFSAEGTYAGKVSALGAETGFAPTVTALSDSSGLARVYFQFALEPEVVSKITATAGSAPSAVFSEVSAELPAEGLKIWLKADAGVAIGSDGKVSDWHDRSIFERCVSQSLQARQPLLVADTLGGKPVIRFNGTSNWMQTAPFDLFEGKTDFSFFIVAKPDGVQANNADVLDYDHWSGGGFVMQQNGYATNQFGIGSALVQFQGGRFGMLGTVKDGIVQRACLDGVQTGIFDYLTPTPMNPPRVLALGGKANQAFSRFYNGDIAELLIYDRALSAEEQAQVETHLAEKYEIYHPSANWLVGYKTAVREVIDSYRWNKARADEFSSAYAALENALPDFPIERLSLWLKADAGMILDTSNRVVEWSDQSPFGKKLVQADSARRPSLHPELLEGFPAVRFDGLNDFIATTEGEGWNNGEFSVVFLMRSAANNNHNQRIGTKNGWGEFLFHTAADGGVYVGTDINSRMTPGQGQGQIPAGSVKSGVWETFAFTYSGGTGKFSKNGDTLAVKSGMAAPGPWTGFTLGVDEINQTLNGDIGEVIVFGRELAQNELTRVEVYLADRYGLYHPEASWLGQYDPAIRNVVHRYKWTKNRADEYAVASAALQNANPPFATDGLILWLKGGSGVSAGGNGLVSRWEDQSAMGNHAVQNTVAAQPLRMAGAVNGQDAIRFDGANDFLTLGLSPTLVSDDFTYVVVTSFADTSGSRALLSRDVGSGAQNKWIFWHNGSGLQFHMQPGNRYFSSQPFARNVNQFGICLLSKDGSLYGFRRDGLDAGAVNDSTAIPSINSDFRIGQAENNFYLNGNIAEILVFERPLSVEELQEVESYLTAKYALEEADTDGDGMPNGYELANGLDPFIDDTLLDKDGDGIPNQWEYAKGTAAGNAADGEPDWIVSPSEAGSRPNIVATIGEAVAGVQVSGTTPFYESILVKPGTYAERVVIPSNKQVALVGDRGGRVVITGTSNGQSVVRVEGRSVLEGLEINRPPAAVVAGIVTASGVEVYNPGHKARLSNCVVLNQGNYGLENQASPFGNWTGGNAEAEHCTFHANKMGAVYSYVAARVAVTNSILWAGTSGTGFGYSTSYYGLPDLAGSIVKGGIAGGTNADPLLSAEGRLTADSPAIDAAVSTNTTADIEGEERPSGTAADLGADEWVDSDNDGLADAWELKWFETLANEGSDDNDGLTKAQEALYGTDPTLADTDGDGALDGEEITAGTSPFVRDTDFDGMEDGYELANGLDPFNDDTLLDKDGDGIPNQWEYAKGTAAGNAADREPDWIVSPSEAGSQSNIVATIGEAVAGVQFSGTTPFYESILVKPGTYAERVVIPSNKQVALVGDRGGRVVITGTSNGQSVVRVEGRSVLEGLEINRPPAAVVAGIVTASGVEVYNPGYKARLSNCVVLNQGNYGLENQASPFGNWTGGNAEAEHCTFHANKTGAVYSYVAARVAVTNSILWAGTSGTGFGYSTSYYGLPDLAGSIVKGGIAGGTNTDPLLSAEGRLTAGSPAIDAAVSTNTKADIEGEERPSGTAADLGADEWVDSDSDGLPDAWEMKWFETLANEGSDDNDGLTKAQEVLYGTDPTEADTDGDGLTDGQEVVEFQTNPLFAETVAASPAFSPDAGFYRDPVTVTFSVNAPLPQIRYTLDGSEPTAESPLAPAEGITLTATATVKAKAFRGDFALTPTGLRRYIVNSEARFPLNGVKVWMKADDGVQVDGAGKVASWANQSEATPAAVQTGSASRPALIPTALPNGLPVVRFSGSNTSLSIASPGNLHSTEGHMTVFVFGKWEGGSNLGPFLAMPRSNSWADGGWGLGRLHTGTNTGETLGLWSNNYSTQKATMTVPQNVYSLVGGMRDSEGLKVFLGGELAGTLAVSGTITPSTGSLFLGAHPATGRYLAGDIAEVLVYSRALNESEFAEVEAYFHDRYGRSVIRPITMPPPGVYDGEVAVTLSSLTPGATIRYTVDGSEPTESSSEASGPILLDQPGEITLKARAFADGAIPSAVVSGVYRIDDAAPEYSAPLFNQEPLVSGVTVSGAGALSIAATDLSGINRVEFYIDGQLLGVSSTAPAGRYSLPWNITGAIPDGVHEVKFRIFDNLGKSSEVIIAVTLALARPGAPAWISPASGAEIAASSVRVKGTAAVGSAVTIYRNGSAVATGVPVNGNGQFEALVSLLEGSQVFTAAAAFRPGEVGPVSAGLAVVRDEAVPEAPLSLSATAQASGRVRLEWVASPSANVGNYKVYRAASSFDQATSATLIATTSAGTLTLFDTPSAGSRHYYRVQAVSTAQVAGPLSAQASAEADASAPTASAIWSSVSAPSAEGVFGVGRIAVRLTVSEPQQAVPFLSIQPAGGLPSAVSLTQDATNSLVFTGQYEIAPGTPGGTAAVSFVGRDVAGNRGVSLTAGSGVAIDAQAPVVIAGSIPLAVKNDPENPVTIPIEIELNEPVAEAPTLKYRLSVSQPQEQSLAMQAMPDSEGLNWTASLVLPATAGAETEDLTLSLAAVDALGNAGGSFANPAAILVYQGQLPGLPPPMLRADSAPGGAVNLDWDAVAEADEYVLYWGQTDDVGSLVELATLPAGQRTHVHTPETDGTYYYAVAARRTVNDEESALILSAPAVSAVSDRVPPAAPADLQLALSGDGVSATWSRPAGSGSEPLTYQFLRGATSPVPLDAGVVREGIETTQTLDSSPTPAQTHYAVVALDEAGNRSAPSAPASLNAALYPPATFRITSKLDGSAPAQLEWTQNGTVHTAHLIAVGEDGALEPLATVPTGTNTYADASYSGGSKRYVISSVDAEDNASPARALRVPGISLVPAEGQSLGRGIMNRLRFTVTNTSEHSLEQGVLKITASGREHASGAIQLAAGASTLVDVLVPGYLDLAGSSVALDIAFSVEPSPGTSATLTSSVSLPVIDHAIPVTLQVRDLLRGGSGFASFTVENPGAEPLEIVLARNNGSMDSPDVRFRLEDTAGNLIVAAPVRTQTGGGVFNLPDGSTVLRIPAGGTVTSPEFVIPVPETAPVEGVLALEIDRMWFRHGSPEAVDLPLDIERTAAVSTVEPPYSAVVLSAAPATSHGTVPVEISGTATLRGGGAAAGRPVALTIARGAYERTVEVVAGEDGTFAYSFALGQGEPGGEFQVWAHHPDQTSRYPQASFLITRVVATPADIVVKAPRNYSKNIALQLQATGGGASGIRAELHAADQPGGVLPAGLTIHSGTVPSLTSTATLNLSLLGDSTAVESQIALRLVSNETAPGGFQTVRIRFSPGEARPALAVKPQSLSTGVAPGQSVSETLVVTNTGLAPLLEGSWKLLKSDGTAAPAWATQGSTGSFGQLEPGSSVDLGLRFDPPAGETPADHYLKIVLKGANHNAIEIPIHVAVSPSGEGNFALRVIDALTGGTAESGYVGGVAGARVRLQNANVPSIVHEAVTDANGEIGAQGGGLTDVPTGLYDLTISSDKHQPYRASLWIRPGATTSELAVLQYEPVKVSWEVVETTIQDKYEVQVTVDYETDVPIPVLVANPTAINLPTMKAGEVYSAEIVIQNHGTIAPDTVWFAAPPANSHYRFELLPGSSSRTAGSSASSTGGNVSGTAPASIPAGAVAFSVPPNGEAKISAQIVALRDSDDSSAGGFLGGQATTRCPNGSVFVQNLAVGVFAPRRRTTNSSSSSHPVVVAPPSGGGSWGGGSAGWHPVGGAGGDDCFIPVFHPGGGGGGPDDGPDPVPGLGPEPEDDSCETCNSCEEGDIGANPSGSGAYQGAASSVDRINREYLDALEDLAIAAPDGRAVLRRAFYGNAWHFAHEKRLDFLPASDHSGTATIVRQRVAYQARDAARTLFTAENYQIRKETAQGGSVTWRWKAPGGKWERFDEQGRLMEYGYRGETYGRVFYPDGASHPSQLQDAEGNTVIELTYADGKLTAAEDFAGNDVSYTWDNGRMTAFTDAAGQTTTMTYDSEGRMTGKVLPTGQQVSIAYTPAGFVSGITGGDRGSQQYAFSYNSTTRTHYMRVTYGTGRVLEYWYDRDGGLIRQAENGQTTRSLTRSGNTVTETDALGRSTVREYDGSDKLLRQVAPDGRVQTWQYDPVYGQTLRHIDARGKVSVFEYTAEHKLTRVIRGHGTPLEQTTTYEWDGGGRLVKITDPRGMVTAMTYDDRDFLLTRTVGHGTSEAQTTSQTYNEAGYVETSTDPLGRVTQYEYDGIGRLLKTTNPLGEETVHTYLAGRLVKTESGRKNGQPGRGERRVYDEAGRIVAEYGVGTNGAEILRRTMTYDAEGRVLTVSNALGQIVESREYDTFGRQIRQAVPNTLGGQAVSITEYDPVGRVSATISPDGLRRETLYDTADRPVRITEAPGTSFERVTEMIYDTRGDLIEERYPDGANLTLVTHYEYDVLGRRKTVSGDRVLPETLTYDAGDNVLTVTDGRGNTTTSTYDVLGRVKTQTLPPVAGSPSAVTTMTYDAAGNLLTQQDGDGRTTGFAYDALGRRIATSIPVQGSLPSNWHTQAASVAQSVTYNTFGDPVGASAPAAAVASGAAMDANLVTTEYDVFGRPVQVTAATGLGKQMIRTTVYDTLGRVVSTRLTGTGIATPQVSTQEYDAANPSLLRQSTDPMGGQTATTYDAANRPVTTSHSAGSSTLVEYDVLGRPKRHTVTAPDVATQVTETLYDRFDQVTQLTLPGYTAQTPRIEVRTYTAKGQLASQSGTATYALEYEYDATGNLTLMRDANGSETRWTYDARNLLAEKRYADDSVWSYTYDAAGNMTTRKDALDRTTAYAYNAFRQLSQINYTTDATVDFSFDAAGRRTGMTDGSGQTVWTPDAWNRNVSSTQSLAGRTLNYAFNGFGQRAGVTFAGGWLSGRTIAYDYDSMARLHAVADSAVNGSTPFLYSYQPGTAWVDAITTPSGSAIVNTRDALGRVKNTTFAGAGGQSLNSFAYGYNAAGQRATEAGPRGNISFGYNSRSELVGATGLAVAGGTAGDFSYNYDGIGNRLEAGGPGFATEYVPNALNQYAEIQEGSSAAAGSIPAHDLNGNMTGDGAGATLMFDEENRLVAWEKGPKRSEFLYDGLSRRVETKEFEDASLVKTVRYVYDGLLPVEEQEWLGAAAGAPVAVRQITRGTDLSGSLAGAGGVGGLLAHANGTTSAWYFADANGNVANLFKADDTVAAGYVYDPFGRRLSVTGSLASSNTYQWSSKEHHEPSGSEYYLYRYYNPETGRWVNRDPIEELGGPNLYGFILNAPVSDIDCFGLFQSLQGAVNWTTARSSVPIPISLGSRLLGGAVSIGLGLPIGYANYLNGVADRYGIPRPYDEWYNLQYPYGEAGTEYWLRQQGQDVDADAIEVNRMAVENQIKPAKIFREVARWKDESTGCCFIWDSEKLGHYKAHDEYTSKKFNPDHELVVIAPDGDNARYDGGVSYPGPIKLVVEAKTGRRWSTTDRSKWSPKQQNIFSRDGAQFSKQNRVANKCKLAYSVFMSESEGAKGYQTLFRNISVVYAP